MPNKDYVFWNRAVNFWLVVTKGRIFFKIQLQYLIICTIAKGLKILSNLYRAFYPELG